VRSPFHIIPETGASVPIRSARTQIDQGIRDLLGFDPFAGQGRIRVDTALMLDSLVGTGTAGGSYSCFSSAKTKVHR